MKKQLIVTQQETIKTIAVKYPDFDKALEALKTLLKNNFTALHPQTNPVVAVLADVDAQQVAFVIKEYSAFSYAAIHMLLDASLRNHDWKLLQDEILRNINEEKGEETKDIPHLEMMRQGYKIDLGIETDNYQPSGITQSFLRKMHLIFKDTDNAFVAGALMAFEGSAIPEFSILDEMVTAYRQKNNMPAKNAADLTKLYIDGHKYFEIGHEQGLIDAVKPFITESNVNNMVKGYCAVCATMNIWWEQLAYEMVYTGIAQNFALAHRDDFDVRKVLLK